MHISRDALKKNYEAYSTSELVDLYVNSELTDTDRSVLSECLLARGEQLHILDEQIAKKSTYIEPAFIKNEVKKGQHSLYNFLRWPTWLAFLVGTPFCIYLQMHGWKVGSAIMVTILPSWAVFYVIEYSDTNRKVVSLSDIELTNIAGAKVGDSSYQFRTIARNELKRRSRSKERT